MLNKIFYEGFSYEKKVKIFDFQATPQKKENFFRKFRDHLERAPNIALQTGKKKELES